jgi:large subunit ribosomal protein L21e
MGKASKGPRKGTRSLFRVTPRERGKVRITRVIQRFDVGDKAAIEIDSRVRGGQPHNTFNGKTGVVIAAQGRAYLVRIRIGGKFKVVVAAPAHLRRMKALQAEA